MNSESTRNVEDLIRKMEEGYVPNFLFFWGHTPKVPGRIDQSCLSNWYPAHFEIEGVWYSSTEHYMMAAKAKLFGDTSTHEKILNAKSPGEAKRFGRMVSNFDETKWMQERFEIVVAGNLAKFDQNPEMKEFLKSSGEKILVEASPQDRIWGIGMARDHKSAEIPREWKGLNLLGFALMEVRSRITLP